jgi:transposase
MLIEVPNLESVQHIPESWYIERCQFDDKLQQMDVHLQFCKEATFVCSGCGSEAKAVKDIAEYNQVWCHLNFAEYLMHFHAEHPRTICGTYPGRQTTCWIYPIV